MSGNREEFTVNFVNDSKGTKGRTRQKTTKQIEMEREFLAELMPPKPEEPEIPGSVWPDIPIQDMAETEVDAVFMADMPAPDPTVPPEDVETNTGTGDIVHDIVAVNGMPVVTHGKIIPEHKRNFAIIGVVAERVRTHIPERPRKFLSLVGRKLATPMSIFLFLMMFAAIGIFIRNQYTSAVAFLDTAPEKAYELSAQGNEEAAKQLWIQINSKMFWYQPFSGILTNIDQPYLQKASVAYMAGDWQAVVENAYKSLQVPITDQQAVYAQQMILRATSNMLDAYLPEQPIRGGVPAHAQPVCEPSATYIWVVPAILMLLAGAFLYSHKRYLFALMALLMPLYFWGLNASNAEAIKICEARLDFNPEHITLYGEPKVPLPPFTPTPLRVETVPINKSVRPTPEPAPVPKTDFGMTSEPLRIESGNAPVRK